MNHRELWAKIFGDTDKYIDFYFKRKAKKCKVFSQYCGDELVSMAYFMPYTLMVFGKEMPSYYIEGVATDVEYRRQGRMRELMLEAMTQFYEQGKALIYLSPERTEYYTCFDFEGAYYREEVVIDDFGEGSLAVLSYSKVMEERKEELVNFVNQKLMASTNQIYVERSLEYYKMQSREAKALGGDVLTFCDTEGSVVGVVYYTKEENEVEVQEMICHREYAGDMVDSLRHYLMCTGILTTDCIYFHDNVFLPKYVESKRQDKPFVMARIINMNALIDFIPEFIWREAFGCDEKDTIMIRVHDPILPHNTGEYCVAEGDKEKAYELSIAELERKLFSKIHFYMNDIT